MADVGYLWDEDKYRQVVKRHEVHFREIVAALDDPRGFEEPDPAGHPDRWLYVGMTAQERLLVVVYSDEDVPVYRLITAFDAKGAYRDGYYRQRL